MQNGDRYNGRVLSVTSNTVVLQNENLGRVSLSRGRIANVEFETNAVASLPKPESPPPATNHATLPAKSKETDISASLRELGTYTNLIQKVQSQFLAAAGSEANSKFSQMLNDLTTGKMNIADLRAQAKDVADQLRSLQRESGDDAGFTMNIYLSILDHFLEGTALSTNTTTNASSSSLKPQP
jgi:hypothetical protein